MEEMRAGQIDAVFEMATFQLDLARHFDVSEVEPIDDDGVSEPEAAMMDIGEIFGEQRLDKGCSDDAVRGRRVIGCQIDEAPIGHIFEDEFLCDAFGLEVGWIGKGGDGQ